MISKSSLDSAALQVNVNAVLDKMNPGAIDDVRKWLMETSATLADLPKLPEVDWSRMRSHLDFQETVRRRDILAPRLDTLHCRNCPSFQTHVRTTGTEGAYSCLISHHDRSMKPCIA